jgi:2-octaprenyl-6-methoxyphenol hydroxylase
MDVLIAGGSFVGLSLGLALARGGLTVTVAEPLAQQQAAGFDGRVSALSFTSVRMLRQLGVWQGLQAQPIASILVTDAALGRAPSPFSLYFDRRELGTPLGFIVENRLLRQALFAAAGRTPGLRLLQGAVETLAPGPHAIVAKLSNGSTLEARLAVAADGRDSPLRTQMGIGVVRWSYAQSAIVATVRHDKPHNGVAYEHFLPSGPFAILPLSGNRASLVWTEGTQSAAAMLRLDDEAFDAEIAKRFGAHLGPTKAAPGRWSYPLRFHLARAYVKARFALAGDAAHGIHPIAGQGLNLGLKDAAALTDVVLEAVALGLDPGSLAVLRRYEQWRRCDGFVMAAATDGLNRLFSNDLAPLRQLRDLGLGLVDKIGPLRRYFMRQAGGESAPLPTLMRETT